MWVRIPPSVKRSVSNQRANLKLASCVEKAERATGERWWGYGISTKPHNARSPSADSSSVEHRVVPEDFWVKAKAAGSHRLLHILLGNTVGPVEPLRLG